MKTLKKVFLFGLGFMGMMGVHFSANASTASTTLPVSATVNTLCSVSTLPMAFGNYNGAITDASATINVTCTNTTPYDIGLDPGQSPGANTSTRAMLGPGGAPLNYALYIDSGRGVNWGNNVGNDTNHQVATGILQQWPVYGRIPANQFVQPGGYSDTVAVTLTY